MTFSLIHLLIAVLVIGIILYAIEQIPMDDWLKRLARIVCIGVLAIYLILTLLRLLPPTAV